MLPDSKSYWSGHSYLVLLVAKVSVLLGYINKFIWKRKPSSTVHYFQSHNAHY